MLEISFWFANSISKMYGIFITVQKSAVIRPKNAQISSHIRLRCLVGGPQ